MMTGVGVILGTAAYMSPEQARGKPVDRRTDIWAFGAVLYEMLTGQRAFPGDDVSITLASVLMKEPEWGALPAGCTPTLIVYLKRCLYKDSNSASVTCTTCAWRSRARSRRKQGGCRALSAGALAKAEANPPAAPGPPA